ncbi:MAG TPA: imidazoleglycerol-phosphate dehydratase HisB [Dehalococcoidia bacterium]|nr:imidazoleglycerol-phosphate dehydratase HisB [Dehalococcoidia bacterium]
MNERKAKIVRNTKETSITITLNIDGSGKSEITTGILFFDHMLNQIALHGVFDIKLSASGSDEHHVIEDVAICLGKAFSQALGQRQGIVRMSHAVIPMDEALAMVAVDIGGRGVAQIEADFSHPTIGEMNSDLIRHFLVSFAIECKMNLHVKVLSGINDHHKAEAIFKALARALDAATILDSRISESLPSTKDYIET